MSLLYSFKLLYLYYAKCKFGIEISVIYFKETYIFITGVYSVYLSNNVIFFNFHLYYVYNY